jgi:phage terminase small subunit
MELKGKREVFAREYLKDLNGTQAAIRAGYSQTSARTEASQLLAREEVQERVAELAAARNKKFEVEAIDVLLELHRILTADISLAIDQDTGKLKDVHDIPIDVRRAISSIENEEIFEGSGKDRVWTGYLKKVKFWSKEKSAELLGRHLALFKDSLKLEATGELAAALSGARTRSQSLV